MNQHELSATDLLQKGIAQAQAGNKMAARKLIFRAAMLAPDNELIWLYCAGLANEAKEAHQALARARALNPAHPQLAQAQAWIDQNWPVKTTEAAVDIPTVTDPKRDLGISPGASRNSRSDDKQADLPSVKILSESDKSETTPAVTCSDKPSRNVTKSGKTAQQPSKKTTSVGSHSGRSSKRIRSGLKSTRPDFLLLKPQFDKIFLPVDEFWHKVDLGPDLYERIRAISWAKTFFSQRLGTTLMPAIGLVAGLGLLMMALNFISFSEAGAAALLQPFIGTPVQPQIDRLDQLRQRLARVRADDDRASMIDTLVKIRAMTPADEKVTAELARLYYEQGLAWRTERQLEQARQSFEWALQVEPELVEAEQQRDLAGFYLAGMDHYQEAEWAKAIERFRSVYEQDPTYLHVDEILYSAYFNLGVVQEAAEGWVSALESYRQAEVILPGRLETARRSEAVQAKLNPAPRVTPSETIVEKKITVDISEQRAYVYENDKLVHKFIISTGEPGRDTAVGEFEIQSKISMAYASTWNLDMPYWLGIYWAGPLENGFHAVPTVRHTGQTMWDGYLGQRVSYGCVILSMEDAKTLYEWAEMGTSVLIRP